MKCINCSQKKICPLIDVLPEHLRLKVCPVLLDPHPLSSREPVPRSLPSYSLSLLTKKKVLVDFVCRRLN